MVVPRPRGFSGGSVGKRICLQCGRLRFDPWVRKMLCRREWQPTPVFLPAEFHGQRSLVGYSSWGYKESDATEHMCTHAERKLDITLINLCQLEKKEKYTT